MHANGSESKAPLPSTDKLTSTSKVKQASLNEPSPASTYGDTTAGGNSPATPLDIGSHGKCMCSFPALHVPRSVFSLASQHRDLLGLDKYESLREAQKSHLSSLPLMDTPV